MGFLSFQNKWYQQLHQLVQKLKKTPRPPTSDKENDNLTELAQKFLSHLSDYYRVKAALAHQDVLFLLAAPWNTKFEGSLRWLAGWRPSTVFQVIHTQSNILFENYLFDMLDGAVQTGDLGNLSPDQMKCLGDLHCQTTGEENDLNDQLADWQDVASDMMLLRHEDDKEELMDDLGTIVRRGDELRMQTLRKAVQLLTPHQTVDFLVSAAQLHSLVSAWGEKRDIADGIDE
ncbi:protein DOG1-like 3 [Apium graveolens]|uniref:protein DOG1-like 3 n=1 Tax=Apium graveolens TaxID=4045 RepID=UPI003D79271D